LRVVHKAFPLTAASIIIFTTNRTFRTVKDNIGNMLVKDIQLTIKVSNIWGARLSESLPSHTSYVSRINRVCNIGGARLSESLRSHTITSYVAFTNRVSNIYGARLSESLHSHTITSYFALTNMVCNICGARLSESLRSHSYIRNRYPPRAGGPRTITTNSSFAKLKEPCILSPACLFANISLLHRFSANRISNTTQITFDTKRVHKRNSSSSKDCRRIRSILGWSASHGFTFQLSDPNICRHKFTLCDYTSPCTSHPSLPIQSGRPCI
jgi:hypothetical protein